MSSGARVHARAQHILNVQKVSSVQPELLICSRQRDRQRIKDARRVRGTKARGRRALAPALQLLRVPGAPTPLLSDACDWEAGIWGVPLCKLWAQELSVGGPRVAAVVGVPGTR